MVTIKGGGELLLEGGAGAPLFVPRSLALRQLT